MVEAVRTQAAAEVVGMSDFYLTLLWLAVGAAVLSLIALPFVYVRGMRQIDEAMEEIWSDRSDRESSTNVRVLDEFEAARRAERERRNGGDVA
jgi:hypothetical protein